MVRSCKRVFYAILGPRKLTDKTLNTTMCLIEGSLNARLLTPVSDNPDSLEALTPNHFLLGQLPSLRPSENYSHSKRYARAQSYANAIWQRWLSEYDPTLNKRNKAHAPPEYSLKMGDMMWLVEPTSPRGHHPLARIMSLNHGKTTPPAPQPSGPSAETTLGHSLSSFWFSLLRGKDVKAI